MKMRFKRFLSGFMAVATLASVIVQPVTVSASELEPETTSFEQQYPELQYVQDTLDEDEIVKAKDIEIPYGEEFEVEVDLSGIEGVNEKKVKVLFHEAKSEAGTDFDAHTPDTYKAVYAVEPVSGHPAYRVSRNITVKEPETEAQTKSSSENTAGEGNAGETEDSGNADEDADSDGSKEIVTDLTDEQEVTTDEESGLAVSEVMDQAENEGIDLYEMEPGETVTFMAATGNARSSQQVSVTRGAEYRYADYGYGTYLTYQYFLAGYAIAVFHIEGHFRGVGRSVEQRTGSVLFASQILTQREDVFRGVLIHRCIGYRADHDQGIRGVSHHDHHCTEQGGVHGTGRHAYLFVQL